jgi:hypothetical protein
MRWWSVDGSVRSYLWWSTTVPEAPVCVEQMRFYSALDDWGTTRTLEASDLIHCSRGLDKTERALAHLGRRHVRPPSIGDQAVRAAIERRFGPKPRVFVSGNVAALLWKNYVLGRTDAICKVELVAVHEGFGPERFIVAGQLGDARKCLAAAEAGILAIQEETRRRFFQVAATWPR